ncbi:MAG: DPP IV N-terminal domain-containing protein, partial [Candidatus Krumholzibacteriota bacterium]|nr:DPP IV N-terminal domain-containing protein [Candidatus Krumholzibacteriota bacterium]
MRSSLVRVTIPWLVVLLGLAGCDQGGDVSLEAQETVHEPLTRNEQKRFEDLTIREIMQGPGIVGTAPSNTRFSADGATVFFEWNSPERLDSLRRAEPERRAYQHYLDLEHEATTWALDVQSGDITRISPSRADTVAAREWAWDHARRRRAEIRGGDIYLVDTRTRRITGTLADESDIQITPDGSTVFFTRDGNVFSVAWAGGPAMQITHIVAGDDPDAEENTLQRQHLIDQQKELFDEFKERPERDEREPAPVYIGEGFELDHAIVSPSGRYIALDIVHSASGTRAPLVPLTITESGYVETDETRPKVGEEQDETRVVLIDVAGDSLLSLEADESMWVNAMSWSPTADVLLIRTITADWHDRYFMTVDPEQGDAGKLSLRELDHYHDDAWTGGPGFYETGEWMPDGSGIYFIGETDGWGHLYTVSVKGERKQITDGDWEVQRAWFDGKRGCWYVLSNEMRWGSSRLWRMNLDGSDRRLLTPEVGSYQVVFDGEMGAAAVLHSTVTRPEELYLFDTASDALRGAFTKSTTGAFDSFAWVTPEEVVFEASDGVNVRAHIFTPEEFGAKPNGAGIVFVHGAGYLQ